MTSSQRIEDYGIRIGRMPKGLRNTIADVPGVAVGHCTLADGPVQTGVTAVIPAPGNLFREKVMAACHVINGFGKSCGIVQIEEMGTLETPILLTNTFGVGAASEALVRSMLAANPDIGRETGTVNPAVFECNDGFLNDIRALPVRG
ncbi:MAG: S58 family peptidase, partial [Synergistaceae bacterium]|nr:S58 family peptidase [Synergistaceae bacterium]